MAIWVILTLHDQDDESHSKKKLLIPEETTMNEISKKIREFWKIPENYQEIFSNGIEIVSMGSTLRELEFKNDDVIVVKHEALKQWVAFLALCNIANDTTADMEDRKNSAKRAVDLAPQLDSSNFFFGYVKFAPTFELKRGQAMRLIDELLPAFKESAAKTFFANLYPNATVEFEPKTSGVMSGTIAKVKTDGDVLTRYYLKTYHRAGTSPNMLETFTYRLLNFIDCGPIVFFPSYFIMTKQVEGFEEFEKIENGETQIKLVTEAYLLRLILGITDLHSGNFGRDKNDQLAVVDFCPPRGDLFLRRDIVNDFKNKNKLDELHDVCEVLKKIGPEKRVQIGKAALERWIKIRSVTSHLIDDEMSSHGITYGTGDVESYIEDIKANFETLRIGLQ